MAQRRLFGLLHSMHWSRAKSITVEAPKVAWTCCHDSRAALAGKRWMHSLSSVWYIIKRNSYAVQRSYAKKGYHYNVSDVSVKLFFYSVIYYYLHQPLPLFYTPLASKFNQCRRSM